MKIDQFINDFISELDDDLISSLSPDINFRELEAWDSLTALSIMAMLDDKYNVNLSADEMRTADTLQELYALVESKMK
jgi:acyl carrier protein